MSNVASKRKLISFLSIEMSIMQFKLPIMQSVVFLYFTMVK
jgi:hypothetical protein